VAGTANCWTSSGVAIALSAVDACAQKQITYALAGAQTGGATVAGGAATVSVTTAGSTTFPHIRDRQGGQHGNREDAPDFIGKGAADWVLLRAIAFAQESAAMHGHGQGDGDHHQHQPAKVQSPFSFTQTY